MVIAVADAVVAIPAIASGITDALAVAVVVAVQLLITCILSVCRCSSSW